MPYADPEQSRAYFRRVNQLPHRINRPRGPGRITSQAKKKASEYNRRWRLAHPERWKELSQRSQQRRRVDPIRYAKVLANHRAYVQKVQAECHRLKETTPCQDCSRLDFYYLMDFEHPTGRQPRSPGQARSLNELAKLLIGVEIVCVRCHRIRTHTRRATPPKT